MTAKIQGQELRPDDIGRWVTFTSMFGNKERGVLSSFRSDGSIFVRFKGPDGERCNPEDLSWG